MQTPNLRTLVMTAMLLASVSPIALANAPKPTKAPAGFTEVAFLSPSPQRNFKKAKAVLDPHTDYGAVLETNKGTITLDLFEGRTPKTVNNFVFLARHHFYDGLPFHQVVKGFMALTGDPKGDGSGNPGYTFGDEMVEGLYFDRPGRIGMANGGPGTNSNGSQFFITSVRAPLIDGYNPVFGQVTQGIEVVKQLTPIDSKRPSTIIEPWQNIGALAKKGITLKGDKGMRLEDYFKQKFGRFPAVGTPFKVDGYRGVIGQGQDEPLIGFYPQADTLKSVTIISRPK